MRSLRVRWRGRYSGHSPRRRTPGYASRSRRAICTSQRTLCSPSILLGSARLLGEQSVLCNLYLAENALLAKQTSAAKEYAVEAVNQATAAIELDPQSSDARVWYGQTIQVRAKILEGGLGQARVCSSMVQSWDRAVELAPTEPHAYHLLGSFGFHTSALPWIAAQSMRSLSPGLRKFSEADALRLLLKSEEFMTTPPKQYSLANKALIGRLYLKKGEKAEARMWLDRALELAADTTIVFDYAKEACLAPNAWTTPTTAPTTAAPMAAAAPTAATTAAPTACAWAAAATQPYLTPETMMPMKRPPSRLACPHLGSCRKEEPW